MARRPRVQVSATGAPVRINPTNSTRRNIGRRVREIGVEWTCCDIALGKTVAELRPAAEVLADVEPHGQLVEGEPGYPVKLNLLCPKCGSDTVLGSGAMKMTAELRDAYLAGKHSVWTWRANVHTMQPQPARLPFD